tara:strand:- start:679 stop:2706 length:2028 start_codon:yes stop_codon:yes gene_type:complete
MANEFSRKESVSDYEIYQGREGSQLNFQEEASKIVTGVNAIATEREGKKAKIQTDTDDVIAQLEKADSFQNQTLGQTVLLAAKGLKETLLMQSKLMKKGKIKPADFMATLQTAKDDMANWGIAAKDWNEKYKVSEERQKLDPKTNKIIASGMETAIKESTLAFNNLNNVVPFTSATGNSYLVRLNEDGSMPDFETQKDRYGSFNNMNNLLLYQDDNAKYDLTSLIANEKKNVGAFITSTISGYTVEAGGNIVVTREGAREMEDALKGEEGGTNFTKMVNTLKGSILSDNLSIANILVNESFGDDGYIIAQTEQEFVDKGGKDLSKWIEADYSSQPPSVTLKDGQKTAAEGFVEDKILIQFGQKTTKTKGFAGQQESSSTNTSDKVDVEDAGYISELNDVFTNPNAASSKAILKRLIDSRNAEAKTPEDKIVSFDIEDTRIIIKRGGGQDDLIIDRIGDSGVPNDPNTPEDESLNILDTETDIMSAIDILTPGKGYSRGRVRDLIKSQKITINPRLNRDLKTSVSKPPIKIVTNTTEVSDGKTVIGELEKAIGGTTKGNWDSTVIAVVDDIIVGVMSGTLKRELASQGFGSPTTETVTVNGEEYYKIKIAGKETSIRISGGETKTNIANQIVDAINEATKKVNKGRESKTVDSFNIWKRSNPGKSFTDYTAWRKLQ